MTVMSTDGPRPFQDAFLSCDFLFIFLFPREPTDIVIIGDVRRIAHHRLFSVHFRQSSDQPPLRH